jgi:hypothetical protein
VIVDPRIWIVLGALAAAFGLGAFAARAYYSPRLDAANARVESLSSAIAAQNAAVDSLREAGVLRERAALKAMATAAQAARAHEARAQQLLREAPPAGVDACQAASDLIRLELAR